MEIMESQTKLIDEAKKDMSKVPRLLIIFEDIQSSKKFQTSPQFRKIYFMGRHFNISSMILCQSYNQTPRAVRMQYTNVFAFKATKSEEKVLCEEFCPAGMNAKEFAKMFQHATREPYNFMHINTQVEKREERYRKNLDIILSLS